MNRKNFLSLFVVAGLLIALPILTGALARQGFEIRISALEDDAPKQVTISDITATSFRVSWITEREVIGGVKLDGTSLYEDAKASFHSVEVTSLTPRTSYTFVLLSDSSEFSQENGAGYSVQTAGQTFTNGDFLVYGQVFSPDGYTFQQGGLITLTLSAGDMKSQLISTIINETGGYQFNLGNISTENFASLFNYRQNVSASFTVYTSYDSPEIGKVFPVDFNSTRQIPNIYLGDVNIDVIPAVEGEL